MLLVGRMGRLGAAYNEDMTHDPKRVSYTKTRAIVFKCASYVYHFLTYLMSHCKFESGPRLCCCLRNNPKTKISQSYSWTPTVDWVCSENLDYLWVFCRTGNILKLLLAQNTVLPIRVES